MPILFQQALRITSIPRTEKTVLGGDSNFPKHKKK